MNLNHLLANSELKQRAALIFCGLFALLVFITFVYSAWQWRLDWQLAHQPIVAAAVTTTDETTALINGIPNAHLFGKAIENSGQVPISSLQLRVTGIVKVENAKNGAQSKAYISIAGAPAKIYEKGDSLPYGVKIYDIQSDAVILENDGKLEKLPLPRDQLEFKERESEETM